MVPKINRIADPTYTTWWTLRWFVLFLKLARCLFNLLSEAVQCWKSQFLDDYLFSCFLPQFLRLTRHSVAMSSHYLYFLLHLAAYLKPKFNVSCITLASDETNYPYTLKEVYPIKLIFQSNFLLKTYDTLLSFLRIIIQSKTYVYYTSKWSGPLFSLITNTSSSGL